ncbi:MAG: Gfo/Idh/MocA family oxidoreductase [Ruminococcaceae bacterium]|nr:Gfo/Idh/MocA family oxidoreductase [Oscillospiraceae bacterium]
MKKIGYCVVGLGIGQDHLAAAAKNPNVDYLAVCDIDENRLEKVKAKYSDLICYTSFDEMLKDPKIDIVSICLPSGMHADFAVKALDAGKNVLCEKPIDISVEKALTIEEARIRSGKKVGVIFQIRNNPIIREAKKALDEGRFGKIILGNFAVKWYRDQPYYDAGGWRGTWAMDGGGSLMNQAVHTVDIMQWFMGDVESVQGIYTVANHNIETEDLTSSVIRFKNGATATFVSTTCCNPSRGTFMQVYGADGCFEITGETFDAWKPAGVTPEEEKAMIEKYAHGNTAAIASTPGLVLGHASQVNDMIDAVINDRDPQVGPLEAIKAVRIINAVYESSRTGKVIYFD